MEASDIWAAISWNSLYAIVALHGWINSKDYLNILEDHVRSYDPGIIPWWWRHFPIRQRSNTYIHTWYEEHKSCIEHIEWPQQSPDLNIIENMWCVLERQVRNCYPPLPCLKELEQVSMEKWLQIPLYEVRKLYDSFPIRIKAVQKVGERQPYIK